MQRIASASTTAAELPPDHSHAVGLRCVSCGRNLGDNLACKRCGFRMEEGSGIVLALAPGRFAYYQRSIADYESIRAAEGRGSRNELYYLALPHRDTIGRNVGQWKIRARSYDYLVRRILSAQGSGELVLDLGAGNCWLSFQLARRGYRTVAVDLLTNCQDGLGAAAHYHSHLPSAIPRFQAELSRLPFMDEQFNIAIFNASFHYSEDYEITLREAFRCLRPGGIVIICDTPWYSREEAGERMLAERHAYFQSRFRTASDSLRSQEFLTDERLRELEAALSIRWIVHHPWYGWRWALRPSVARLRRRREPSRFRIYVAKKDAR
jgi:SAM-dependent methyltransferase